MVSCLRLATSHDHNPTLAIHKITLTLATSNDYIFTEPFRAECGWVSPDGTPSVTAVQAADNQTKLNQEQSHCQLHNITFSQNIDIE